jgi:hypothetical protein
MSRSDFELPPDSEPVRLYLYVCVAYPGDAFRQVAACLDGSQQEPLCQGKALIHCTSSLGITGSAGPAAWSVALSFRVAGGVIDTRRRLMAQPVRVVDMALFFLVIFVSY